MSTAEQLSSTVLTHEPDLSTSVSWPEDVPRDGMALGKELNLIRSVHWEDRIQLMGAQKASRQRVFGRIKVLEDQLSPLTYTSRPFTDPAMARGLAEDLQELRDLYGEGNFVGRRIRGVVRTVRGFLQRSTGANGRTSREA